MKKKLLIGFGVVFGVLAILVIILFTLFALKNIKIDWRTSHSVDSSQEEIVNAGQFSYGMPVMFLNKNKFKENIEKSNPYIEVINIETKFPNSFVVHVRQRQEIYSFVANDKVYFCDNNLVILRKEEKSEYISTQSNSILLTGLALPQQEFQVGNRLEINNYVDFYNSLLSSNLALFEQKSIIKSIDFSIFKDENTGQSAPLGVIHTFAGNDFYIYNADKYLDFKMAKFISAYSGLYDLIGQKVSSASDDLWTEEKLAQADIIINNYYQVTDKNNPVYANVLPKKT